MTHLAHPVTALSVGQSRRSGVIRAQMVEAADPQPPLLVSKDSLCLITRGKVEQALVVKTTVGHGAARQRNAKDVSEVGEDLAARCGTGSPKDEEEW